VIRDYLRRQLSPTELTAAHRQFLAAARTLIPAASESEPVPWWDLPATADYLWRHLPWHLHEAGAYDDLVRLLEDLRWIVAKTQLLGTVVPVEADLALADTPALGALRRAVAQNAHLLTPLEPGNGLGPTLASRLETIAVLEPAVRSFVSTLNRPHLASRWGRPDLLPASTRRILSGHNCWINACTVSPSGTLIASAGESGAVHLWRTDTGELSIILDGHAGPAHDCAFTPDGRTVVTVGDDGTARLWDAYSGQQLRVLLRHGAALTGCAVTPDGAAAVATSLDGTAVVFELHTGDLRTRLAGHSGGVTACAVSPDGRTLASASSGRRNGVRRSTMCTTSRRTSPSSPSGGR
jgi:hypothetical protein